MKRFAFTAQELFCMAVLTQKRKMYGIPYAFGADRRAQMQNTIDILIDEQVAVMDMDGNMKLAPNYREMMDFVCDCSECVTINHQKESEQIDYIIWRYGNRYLMAEAVDHKYIVSATDPTVIQTVFGSLAISDKTQMLFSEAIVPRIALKKAQRLCADGQKEDAIRVLRQQGAEERLALAIATALAKEARSVGIVHMHPTKEACETVEHAFLQANGICLKITQTVQNLRSCAVFTEIADTEINQTVMDVAEKFLREG